MRRSASSFVFAYSSSSGFVSQPCLTGEGVVVVDFIGMGEANATLQSICLTVEVGTGLLGTHHTALSEIAPCRRNMPLIADDTTYYWR